MEKCLPHPWALQGQNRIGIRITPGDEVRNNFIEPIRIIRIVATLPVQTSSVNQLKLFPSMKIGTRIQVQSFRRIRRRIGLAENSERFLPIRCLTLWGGESFDYNSIRILRRRTIGPNMIEEQELLT